MHGTFRSFGEPDPLIALSFDVGTPSMPRSRAWRSTMAALLAGGCLALVPHTAPSMRAPARAKPAPQPRPVPQSTQVALAIAPAWVGIPPPSHSRLAQSEGAKPVAVQPVTIVPRFSPPAAPAQAASLAEAAPPSVMAVTVPPSKSTVPAPADAIELAVPAASPISIPKLAVAPSPRSPVAVSLPDPPAHLALVEPSVAPAQPSKGDARQTQPLRPVDVAQVSDSEVRSLRVPQLNEPGLAAGGGPSLSSRIAAMQVTPLPPARLRDSDRATFLAEAPTRMTLRIGSSALGKVDFHMSKARTIDVQLSGLLDLLAGHYDAAEFARLRNSAAADAYVSVDQLRALGLSVHYDAVYDELRING